MSRDLNHCFFVGRLGKDPETRFMPNGNAVCQFSIACGDDYKDKTTGAKVERTEWINLVCFGKTAEIAGQYLRKGSRILAEGKMTTRKWEKDGVTHYSTEIHVSNLQMLDSKPADTAGVPDNSTKASPAAYRQQAAQPQPEPDNFDDDIPF